MDSGLQAVGNVRASTRGVCGDRTTWIQLTSTLFLYFRLYRSMDDAAKKLGVFKVATVRIPVVFGHRHAMWQPSYLSIPNYSQIGDCYVAACGLPRK